MNTLDLKLTEGTQRALDRARVSSVSELCTYTPNQLRHMHGIGPKRLREVIDRLLMHGLYLKKCEPTGKIDRSIRTVSGRLQKYGNDGRPLCKTCEGSLPRFRRSYCCYECELRNTPSMIRRAVEKRDKGVCAGCGVQCLWSDPDLEWHERKTIQKGRPHWQADHIVPVVEGGGLCGLDGYRTLCTDCHKKETKELHARLRLKRNGR